MRKELLTQIENMYRKLLLEYDTPQELISHLYQYNRYYDIINAIQAEMQKLGMSEVDILNTQLTRMYKKNAERIGDEINHFQYDPNQLAHNAETAVKKIWCSDGKHYSLRIWGNKNQIAELMSNTIVDGMARGISADNLTKELMQVTNRSYYETNRIVRTELAYIQTLSTIDTYNEAGVDEYIYLGDQSEVCEDCAALNGKVFKMSEAQVGVNLPPKHCFCRCAIIAVI